MERRKTNTYGKTTKKVLVHDLFGVTSNHGKPLYETVSPPIVDDPSRTRTATPSSEFSEDPETSQQLRSELQSSFPKSREPSAAPSAGAQGRAIGRAQSPHVFDLDSSEDEVLASRRVPQIHKRRRLVETSAANVETAVPQRNASSSNSRKNASYTRRRSPMPPRSKTIENVILQSDHDDDDDTKPSDLSCRGTDPDTVPKHSLPSPLKGPRTQVRVGSPDSGKSTESMASARSTPKRKRNDAEAILSDRSSPSQLGLSSLRLTPGRRGRARPVSVDLEQSDSSVASPSRSRTRMVDKLDSPKSQSTTRDIEMKDTSPRPIKMRKLASESNATSRLPQKSTVAEHTSQPQIQRDDSSHSSRTIPNASKARTYGKQRSHLKDMVAGLDNQSQHSSQSSLQQLLSQVETLDKTHSVNDPFNIESDEDDAGTRLKSIHELRQAGVADRFGRDLEAVFEDIESGNKALRIKGLMQLVGKLQKQAFRGMLLESNSVHRLTAIPHSDLDLTTASILLLAFMALASSETATAQALAQIYKGILSLPIRLLEERRSVSKIARDRTENLSKAVVRDVIEFEGHVVDQSHGGGQQISKTIIVSRVALKTLESLLRRLQLFAERVPEPSADFIEVVLRMTQGHIEAIVDDETHPEHIESVRLLISWLDMTATMSRESIYQLNPRQLRTLADVLGRAIGWAQDDFPLIAQTCISLALELSNGDSSVCEQFAQHGLLQSLVSVIHYHYSVFDRDDAADNPIDEIKHKSAVLALGCLSHLTESSADGRTMMLSKGPDDRTPVDVCIDFFKKHVDDTEEATSADQVPLLETYLWTILLLCTLCLDDVVRDHIRAEMDIGGMEELVNKADKFLSLMKTEDAGFFDRFSATLETVRGSLARN